MGIVHTIALVNGLIELSTTQTRLRELVLGLLEALTTDRLGRTIPTLVDMGNSG